MTVGLYLSLWVFVSYYWFNKLPHSDLKQPEWMTLQVLEVRSLTQVSLVENQGMGRFHSFLEASFQKAKIYLVAFS